MTESKVSKGLKDIEKLIKIKNLIEPNKINKMKSLMN
jgi:hypothetical protein